MNAHPASVPMVSANRRALAKDHPLIKREHANLVAISDAIKAARVVNDNATEKAFGFMYDSWGKTEH